MPKSKKHWIVNLSSEFIGTIFLTWMIALLGVSFNGNLFEKMISFTTTSTAAQFEGVSNLVIGFWVALDVLLCLAIFSRWSCDLNPGVTVYRMLAKQNTLKYGFAKLGTQVVAGFAAAGLIIATQAISHAVSNNPIDALHSINAKTGVSNHTWSAFLDNTNSATAAPSTFPRHLLAFIGEMIGVLILLYPIFTKSIKSPVLKDVILVFMIGVGVAALLELKTVGWNPARALATTVAYDIINPGLHATKLYWAYLLGPIAAAFTLFGLQKLNVVEIANRLWEKWLSFISLGPVAPVDQKPTHTEDVSAIHAYPHEVEAIKVETTAKTKVAPASKAKTTSKKTSAKK